MRNSNSLNLKKKILLVDHKCSRRKTTEKKNRTIFFIRPYHIRNQNIPLLCFLRISKTGNRKSKLTYFSHASSSKSNAVSISLKIKRKLFMWSKFKKLFLLRSFLLNYTAINKFVWRINENNFFFKLSILLILDPISEFLISIQECVEGTFFIEAKQTMMKMLA